MGKDQPRNYEWYLTLKKSPLNPPKWVFPVAWTLLYTLIGISFFSYIQTTGFEITTGLIYFTLQMLGNFVWSPLFFWQKMIRAAFLDIIFMWVFILLTIIQFEKIN